MHVVTVRVWVVLKERGRNNDITCHYDSENRMSWVHISATTFLSLNVTPDTELTVGGFLRVF